jgi:hypothetical protein
MFLILPKKVYWLQFTKRIKIRLYHQIIEVCKVLELCIRSRIELKKYVFVPIWWSHDLLMQLNSFICTLLSLNWSFSPSSIILFYIVDLLIEQAANQFITGLNRATEKCSAHRKSKFRRKKKISWSPKLAKAVTD